MTIAPIPPAASRLTESSGASVSATWYTWLSGAAARLDGLSRGATMRSAGSWPAVADIPLDAVQVWKNTGTGQVALYVNDGGTLKSVLLT